MKLTQESKDAVEVIRLIAGSSYEQCKDFFESLLSYMVLNFLENKPSYIPYLGSITLEHKGDTITPKGKIADIGIQFTPDPNIQKVIGQLADGDSSELEKMFKQSDDIFNTNDSELEQLYSTKINQELQGMVDEN